MKKTFIVFACIILLTGCCTFKGVPQSVHDKDESIYRLQTKIVIAQLSYEVAKLNYIIYEDVIGDSKESDYQSSLDSLKKEIDLREKILKDLLIEFGSGGN